MPLQMTRPTRHPRSQTFRLRLGVPARLRETTAHLYGLRRELIASLQTKDEREAKRRAPAALERLQRMLDRAEAEFTGTAPTPSDRDIAAMAGAHYRSLSSTVADGNVGPASVWQATLDNAMDQFNRVSDDAVQIDTTAADRTNAFNLLANKGFATDAAQVQRLAESIVVANVEFYSLMVRRAEGDWRPDSTLERFPPLRPAKATPAAATPTVDITAILQGWARDNGYDMTAVPPAPAAYERKRTAERLARFLDHRDAASVTVADVVRYKEAMQARNLSVATVINNLTQLSALWEWGRRNGLLTANPFTGISPPKAKRKNQRTRDPRPYTPAEVRTLLEAARKETGLLRWLPFVSAYTGARLSEVVQGMKDDVAELDGVWTLRIHDDDHHRSVKNATSRRTVPLHPALIREGFLRYVQSLPPGSPLFPDVPLDRAFGTRSRPAGRKVGRWVKGLLSADPDISPTHSWRHTFIDACRAVQMPQEVRSALTGHSGRIDESAGYGLGMRSMVAVLAEAMATVAPFIEPPA